MDYLLTVLTNGRRECFERSLHAFLKHVTPRPSAVFVMDDGGQTDAEELVSKLTPMASTWPWQFESTPEPIGMCRAHGRCWAAAAASEYPWAFHLEDDQVLLRRTHLPDLAKVLDLEPALTQMALVRCPWGREIEHGGYIPQEPGWYTRTEGHGCEWIETTRNWCTAPSLFRTSLAREFPWPEEPGCETTIGPQIQAAGVGLKFGLWGGGEPHCAHIGVDRVPSAFGY